MRIIFKNIFVHGRKRKLFGINKEVLLINSEHINAALEEHEATINSLKIFYDDDKVLSRE